MGRARERLESFLVRLAQDNAIDAVHPGYGFLSESADFAARMQDAGITVIGPGSSVLGGRRRWHCPELDALGRGCRGRLPLMG
jgi:hypothetical protein